MKGRTRKRPSRRRSRGMSEKTSRAIADEELRRDPRLPAVQDLPFEPTLGREVIEEAVKKVLRQRLQKAPLGAKAVGGGAR